MALGGGTYLVQNKVMPGAYINFVSAARASASLSDRGVVALPVALDWGVQDKVFTLTQAEFQKDSMKLLGYDYTADEIMPLREAFLGAVKVHVYNLNTGGAKATSDLATALYAGTRGNALKYAVVANVDDESKYDVTLYMGTTKVDSQTVAKAADLADNDYVVWNKSATLEATAGTTLTGGTNGTTEIQASNFQTALDKLESYNYNVLIAPTTDSKIISLFVEYTKRLRDKVGVKFQTVVYRNHEADYEGVVSVENSVGGDETNFSAVYWVGGALAGCAVNKSMTNAKYTGELAIDCPHTQSELEAGIMSGKFMFHMVEDEVRTLRDINTFVSFTPEKNEDFSSNQVIRVIDQRAKDSAALFNTKYLGKVQNDKSGRVSFWADLVAQARALETIRAIEDYNSDNLKVEQGDSKKAVVVSEMLKPTVAMEQLYMTTVIE